MLSYARGTRDDFSYAVVDPSGTNAVKYASSDKGRWIAIKPGTDLALALAMRARIVENEKKPQNVIIHTKL
ncbi:molybdopterin-dependent oxidoreductase, partial [Campylobacter concisus]